MASACQRSPVARSQRGFLYEKNRRKRRHIHLWIASFFQIHRGKFELDPGANRGQPSIWRITHGVFFLRVGKDALNGLRTQRVACLAKRRMPHVLRALYVVVPDMARHGLCALLIFSAAFTDGTIPANVALAFVLPVAFAAGGGITQNLVLWAEDAVVVFIVDICISGQVPLLRHRPFVGRRRDSPAVEDLLADPRRFVARVGGDRLRLGTALDQAIKHPVKDHAVVDIAGRDLCFQHIRFSEVKARAYGGARRVLSHYKGAI